MSVPIPATFSVDALQPNDRRHSLPSCHCRRAGARRRTELRYWGAMTPTVDRIDASDPALRDAARLAAHP
jgi:hypothetical protein